MCNRNVVWIWGYLVIILCFREEELAIMNNNEVIVQDLANIYSEYVKVDISKDVSTE